MIDSNIVNVIVVGYFDVNVSICLSLLVHYKIGFITIFY